MAATLTDELTRVSVADIEKWEDGPDGTLYVYGRCTTPEIDTDDQIVDSSWSGSALKQWLDTAPTVRVQHNAQRDPAGSGVKVDVDRDGDGAHWLKAAVDEPVAQRLVKKGHLRAFSVGIARPVIERDVSGKARGGVIRSGTIVEVSLVDSPANRSCFLEVAKADKDGACEFTGKVIADDEVLQKALGGDLLTKDGSSGDIAEKAIAPAASVGIDTWTAPEDLSITFTPNDMARMLQSKFVEKHYDDLARQAEKRDFDPNVGGGVDRDKLPESDFAGRNRSFPIKTQGDVSDALQSIGRAGDDNYDAATLRANIHRIARRKGFSVPSEGNGDSTSKGTVTETAAKADAPEAQDVEVPEVIKEAEPDVTKDPESNPEPEPIKRAKKKRKKLPPWLNKPKDGDDGDGDGDGDDASKACKSVSDHLWTGVEGTSDIVCSKCHTTPAQAAGLSGTHDMTCAPVPELLESPPVPSTVSKGGPTPASTSGAVAESMTPVPTHREPDGALNDSFEADAGMSDGDSETPARLEAGMKAAAPDLSPSPEVAAILRFQRAGIDPEAGRLHDLTCPAYHPEQVAKYHPFTDFASAVDIDAFQRQAVKAAAGGDLARAKAMQQVWQAAVSLKAADPAWLNDCRADAYKAFRDANPGPNTFPTPGAISPMRYNRPLVTEGHGASSPGHEGPNSSPQVATSSPDAHSFDRPPLSAGHQSPSPSFMKASFEYPDGTGQPQRLNYQTMEKDRARQALMQVHEHLSRQFPEACPISLDGPQQPESRPVPPTAGIGKSEDAVEARMEPGEVIIPKSALPAVALKAEPEGAGMFMDADVYKGFKKMRKKLGKKVLSGSMTVDEARAKLGRQFAQKSADEPQEAVQKAATPAPASGPPMVAMPPAAPVAAAFDPEVIKAAVAEATTELKDLLVKQQQDMAAQQETFTTRLAEQQRVIDAIADQPDPSTAAFSGLAYKNPVQKAARPAAVPDIAENAARAQDMIRRNLMHTYYTNSSPARREAAGEELAKLGWETPMT